jgi:hypothetical protein
MSRGARFKRRRAAVLLPLTPLRALSLLSAMNMSIVGLRQLGVIRHLPDPPLPGFDADRVTHDRAAWLFGVPDAPLEALSAVSNLPLAWWASRDGDRAPWLPLLLGAKTLGEAAIGWWYFEHMRREVGAWCAYCVLQAATNTALAVAMLPATHRAARRASASAVVGVALLAGGGVLGWWIARGRTRVWGGK